ncbi:MAG: hypothetical protein MI723_00320 [Caulobacterales bacterium]|nr:hypothetical protein [Caulobacterales bacterium]
MARRTALVIAPGRGVYGKDELGYLHRHHADTLDLLARHDAARQAAGRETIAELDGADRYTLARYTRGDNAAALIHACAYADFLAIDREAFDIVAITGNSMGWYIALACAGALDPDGGFEVVDTMGTLLHEAMIGGQMSHPFVDEQWRAIPGSRDELLALIDDVPGLYLSIALGGMLVLAGTEQALTAAEDRLTPVQDRFPMRLAGHAAFHTELQEAVAARGREMLPERLLHQPSLPLIDGRGAIWFPHASDVEALWRYTLEHQVIAPYDFTRAVQVGVREFAPDVVIILGPGATLGGAVAQALIAARWRGLAGKQDFLDRQAADPVVLAMGVDDQRRHVLAPQGAFA